VPRTSFRRGKYSPERKTNRRDARFGFRAAALLYCNKGVPELSSSEAPNRSIRSKFPGNNNPKLNQSKTG
jgi:hypothetical protein